ncbi:MAG TPA: DNA strand exchange inhibitor protein [Phycisphaerales bacterium]|nr:DNA strand exchange inhibitor protein [Phycisphaerales bacterium]
MDSFTLRKVEFDIVRRILARYASCSLGKSMALRIAPSRNPSVIVRWLEQTSQMVAAIRDVGLLPFGGVTDITDALVRAKPGGGAGGEDFSAIGSTLKGFANVRAYLHALPENLSALRELADGIGNFEGEIRAIESVIDPDGRVRDDASDRIGRIRREIEQLAQRIRDVIYGYLHNAEVAKLLTNVAVTVHGDRYVLPVRVDNRGRLPGVVHRASNTGATVFVEPNECVELNNRLADLRQDERDEERRLLGELSVRVSQRTDEITSSLHAMAQVDLLSAKAQYAYHFDMTCPAVSEHGPLQFHQARHPLLVEQAHQQEQAGLPPEKRHAVVPIDVRLGSDFDLLVITGSNTGGKTVALKTVALLALMAQSGMHIPAQRGATLPAYRDVFIDVGDEQSLEQSLSTFGAHVKRVRHILAKADRQSLVLLDELGSGTDPEEGGAIGQAILDELRRIGCTGMVTTHLSVLKAYAYTHERVDNASVEFDTRTLSPTYQLRIGTPGESHAITVAQKLGMPKRITAVARQYQTDQGKQFRRAVQATTLARQSAEQARSDATAAQLAAETQQEMYESRLADLHRLKEEFELWLARLGEMKPGEPVFVPSLGKPGKLVRMELHRQRAVVDCDNVQVEVPLREMMPDLGQPRVREEIASLRGEILRQVAETQQAKEEAQRIHDEYHRSLEMQKQRARQFDTWLGAIARLKIGDEVPIAHKGGVGVVTKVNLPALRATVKVGQEEVDLSIQDLFPQTGPFARHTHETGPRHHRGRRHERPRHDEKPPPPKPLERRSADTAVARGNREKLLAVQPGQQVYVVPFHKRATLIRINAEKDQAIVQSGVFEVEIPLADLEPVHSNR